MSNTPPGLIDATISGGFLSDHLDLDQKWWLVNRVMELIDSHSRSAPSCQKLMKPLLEEFFPGSKELPGTSSLTRHAPVWQFEVKQIEEDICEKGPALHN